MSRLDTIVGVPFDCTGRFAGCERLPAALRATGLAGRLGARDAGNLQVVIADPVRDSRTGIVGSNDVVAASAVIRAGIGELLRSGARPLVLGGCCTLLIGAIAAARDHSGRVGLAFVDGHLDFYDGESSPTGEAADMELAILSGVGPERLTGIAGEPPLVNGSDIVVLGARDAEEAAGDGAPDPELMTPGISIHTPEEIRKVGTRETGERAAAKLAEGAFWLHLDLDVLDAEALPAVDYPQPGGLDWEELSEMVQPLAASPHLLGADVTILNPTLDPDGRYARRTTELLVELFGQDSRTTPATEAPKVRG